MASILRTKSAYDIQFSGCDGRAAGAVQDLMSNLAVWQRRALQFSSLHGESNRGNCRCRCRVDSARHRCRRRFRFSQRGTVAQIPLLHATSIIVLSGARRGRREDEHAEPRSLCARHAGQPRPAAGRVAGEWRRRRLDARA